MKRIPCINCITLPICKNRLVSDNIYHCKLLKDFILNANSINKLYNKITSAFNTKIEPSQFKITIDIFRAREAMINELGNDLAKTIDKDIVTKAAHSLFNDVGSPKWEKALQKVEVANEIAKYS